MQMVRGNAAIANHQADGKTIHLFEEATTGQRYVGEAWYLGHHFEQRPDREGNSRQAIIFELEISADGSSADGGNTYIREEQLAGLLGTVITPIQISPEIADNIAAALKSTEAEGEVQRQETLRQLKQRRRTVVSKLDRGYDDYVSSKISEEFWTRKSQEWEGELLAVDAERAHVDQPRAPVMATAT